MSIRIRTLHAASEDGIHFVDSFSLVDKLGIFGIFIGMILQSACIPFSSEVIMLTAGFFVHQD